LGAERVFTYLADSAADVTVASGDARLTLEHELMESGAQNFDVLAIDAFSSDAIPVHLLTEEAIELYLKHLKSKDGILAIHITNNHLDLKPLVSALANRFKLASVWIEDYGMDDMTLENEWILLSQNSNTLDALGIAESASPLSTDHLFRIWTDDYSNLYRLLK